MILDQLVQLQFKKDHVLKCINANKHNHITTSYYLLLKKADRDGVVNQTQFEYFDEKRVAQIYQERLATQKSISGQPIVSEKDISLSSKHQTNTTTISQEKKMMSMT